MKNIKILLTLVKTTALLILLQGTALAYESPLHVFSINDVMGGFDGSTFGTIDLTGAATQDTEYYLRPRHYGLSRRQ